MNTYKRHRFPPDVISYAAWLYYRFNLRRVETVTVILKIYWPSEALLYPEKRSAFGTQSTRCAHGAGSV